mmetsp:Transcript_5595/g.8103  ORF Transcript_5595/g.8103 Transcript_5595/m.8103 type:complete len:307 (+) Transcript_5595:44-964(+)
MVDCICLMSAFFFLLSNILGTVLVAKNANHLTFNLQKWVDLEPSYLIDQWNQRSSSSALFQASSIFNAFAWFLFAIPVTQVAWALSRGGKRRVGVHMAIAGFALGGALAELIARLLIFGSFGAAMFVHKRFNKEHWLPDSISNGAEDLMGWKALEIVFIITEGIVVWIDAFEWISLFFVLILLYFSVGTQMDDQRKLDMWWARLGLFIGFLTFVDFAIDVLRLEDWKTFTQIAIAISFFNTVLLLPIWLIWLGFSMHTVLPQYNEEIDAWSPGIQTTTTANPTMTTTADPTTNGASGTLPRVENTA